MDKKKIVKSYLKNHDLMKSLIKQLRKQGEYKLIFAENEVVVKEYTILDILNYHEDFVYFYVRSPNKKTIKKDLTVLFKEQLWEKV